ncbi:MAG: hypothetical protein H6517_04055 [Microthrixaceae bacterium]|nr:hypothetical protein [Microthrixaceae bacterium]
MGTEEGSGPWGSLQAGSKRAAVATLVLACALPATFFLLIGFAPDDTAERTGGALVFWLVCITTVVGVVLALAAARGSAMKKPASRRVITGIVLAVAALWGLIIGFLGGVAIGYERHPTWDDA